MLGNGDKVIQSFGLSDFCDQLVKSFSDLAVRFDGPGFLVQFFIQSANVGSPASIGDVAHFIGNLAESHLFV